MIQQCIPKLISKDQNEALMREMSLAEVEEVVWALSLNNTPDPDGLTFEFFKLGWKFLGDEIHELVEQSHCTPWIWSGLNAIFMMLIPKKGSTLNPGGFWPISLCNVIYKILSRIIVWRITPLLKNIIGPERFGFVEGKKIMDGIFVAHEVVHSLSSSQTPGILIKLDPYKAYYWLN